MNNNNLRDLSAIKIKSLHDVDEELYFPQASGPAPQSLAMINHGDIPNFSGNDMADFFRLVANYHNLLFRRTRNYLVDRVSGSFPNRGGERQARRAPLMRLFNGMLELMAAELDVHCIVTALDTNCLSFTAESQPFETLVANGFRHYTTRALAFRNEARLDEAIRSFTWQVAEIAWPFVNGYPHRRRYSSDIHYSMHAYAPPEGPVDDFHDDAGHMHGYDSHPPPSAYPSDLSGHSLYTQNTQNAAAATQLSQPGPRLAISTDRPPAYGARAPPPQGSQAATQYDHRPVTPANVTATPEHAHQAAPGDVIIINDDEEEENVGQAQVNSSAAGVASAGLGGQPGSTNPWAAGNLLQVPISPPTSTANAFPSGGQWYYFVPQAPPVTPTTQRVHAMSQALTEALPGPSSFTAASPSSPHAGDPHTPRIVSSPRTSDFSIESPSHRLSARGEGKTRGHN